MGYEVVSIPFGSGLDTKTDPKMLDAPKLTLLKDCIFTNAKRLTKRPGNDLMTNDVVGGSTLSSPTMLKAYRNEFLCAATNDNGFGQRLFSYSKTLSAWNDVGKYLSVKVSKDVIAAQINPDTTFQQESGFVNCSSAIAGNIALFSYDTYIQNDGYGKKDSANSTFYTVKDLSTGQQLATNLRVPLSVGFSKAVLLGPSTLAILYISSSASNRLAIRIISVDEAGGVVTGSEVTIGTCAALADLTQQFPYCYDWINTSAGATLAVANEPNINLYNIDTSGATTATATITSTGQITPITLQKDSSNNIWIYWGSNTTTLKMAIYSSSLSVVLTGTTVTTNAAGFQQLSAVVNGATTQTIYFSVYLYISATTAAIYSSISSHQVNTSGPVGSTGVVLPNADLYGKSFVLNSKTYLPCVGLSASLPTGFIIDTLDNIAAAKFLPNEAEGIYSPGYGISSPTSQTLTGVRYPGFTAVPWVSGSQVFLASGFVVELVPIVLTTSTTNLDSYPLVIFPSVIMGVSNIEFDFDHIDAFQGVVQQDTLALNGGIVSIYDGAYISELGYNIDPDNISAIPSGSSGSMGTTNLVIFVTYSFIDANGNLYESAPSPGVSAIFTTGTSNSVSVTIPTLNLTQKQDVVIKIWASSSALGGNIAFLCGSVLNRPDSAGAPYRTFLITQVDPSSPQLYTQGGAILENIAPPPSMILWANNNRLFCIDSENEETTIEYSKTASQGTGISFSTGQLEIRIDSKYGPIKGASPMDEKTVILKDLGACYFFGDGANDAGTGSTFTTPQFIPSDTGCSNSKSVILFPGGILFRSNNNKGIYLFSRGVQIQYFGLDVNAFNSQDIQSAFLVPNRNQIRFLTSSGFSLLYDYVMGQWSIFTNYQGLSADTFNGAYTYIRTDGSIYSENQTGSYLDDTLQYSASIQMSWIKATSIQNFQRTRRVMLLGDFSTANNGHGVQISVAYDFIPNFSAPIPYIFTESDGPYQYRERLPRQKCDALQFLIEEIVTGASGEFIDFNDLGIEILPKTGLNKLPATRTVG